MKSKIAFAFENCKKEKRAALITYTVAGDNTKNNSNYNFIIDIILLDESKKEISYQIELKDDYLSDDINLFIY